MQVDVLTDENKCLKGELKRRKKREDGYKKREDGYKKREDGYKKRVDGLKYENSLLKIQVLCFWVFLILVKMVKI